MNQPDQRFRVVNQRDQPVELHCGGRVMVLPSRAVTELSEGEVSEPQLAGLVRRGFLSIRALPAPVEKKQPSAKRVPSKAPSKAPSKEKQPAPRSRKKVAKKRAPGGQAK